MLSPAKARCPSGWRATARPWPRRPRTSGAIPGGTLEQVDEARWRAAWKLKIYGYINLTRACYPAMRERGSGVVANIIGKAGVAPRADYICGATANAGLIAFTRAGRS